MFANLPSLKALRSFEAAARHQSISKAAEELALTQGAVSYQVKRLESELGTQLFHRRTRQIETTEAGRNLYRIVHRQFQELDAEILRIAPAGRESTLTVSVSTYFVTRWLSQRLGSFLNDHPQITVRLQHSVNDPDFTVDEVDLAIRWCDGNWPNCQTQLLIELPMIVAGAPELVANNQAKAPTLNPHDYSLLRDQSGIDYWDEWLKKAGYPEPTAESGPVIVDPNVRVQSAVDGQGLVMGNYLMQPELQQGLLVEPFETRLQGYGYYLIYKDSAVTRRPLQIFSNWIKDQARHYEENLGDSKTSSRITLP